jgi:hypothetical protein
MILSSPTLPAYNYTSILISLIISAVIVFPILGFRTATAFISFILLYFLIYIIIVSISSENISNELPSTLYPSEPHLGLDGISLNNYVAGM